MNSINHVWLFKLACVFLKYEYTNDALGIFMKILDIKPDYLKAMVNVAIIYRLSGHYNKARKYLDFDSDNEMMLLECGNWLIETGDIKKAIMYYEKCGNGVSKNNANLANLYLGDNDEDRIDVV